AAPAHCGHWPASAPEFPPTVARAGSRSSSGPLQPGTAGRLREVADAADVGLALGDADYAPRLESVEHVAGLDGLLIGGDRQLGLEAAFALAGGLAEQVEQRLGIGNFEIISGHLPLVLEEDVAVGYARVVESEVEDIVD